MSKEKENKFVDIEDPLAGLGFDEDEAEEVVEDIEDAAEEMIEEVEDADEAIEEAEPKATFAEKAAAAKKKAEEIMKPAADIASKKLTVKNAAVILGAVAVVAIAAAILIFSLYSGATYSSGRSVGEWAQEWNELSFSDTCNYTLYSNYPGTAKMETMFLSDTDHVYLTDNDINALKKGKTVTIFDDIAELSAETYKGDFKSITMSVNYNELCDYYFGEDYGYDKATYSPAYFEDSTFRVIAYMAMFMNPFNDRHNDEDSLLTAALDLYLKNGSAYTYDGGSRMDIGDYTFTMVYDSEEHLVLSGSDISATDVSATDTSASVESHLIVKVTCKYNKAGEKKHAADWSWWDELFPEKETEISGELADQEYDSEISSADAAEFSETDVSAADTAE